MVHDRFVKFRNLHTWFVMSIGILMILMPSDLALQL